MKKVITLFLIATICFSSTACSGSDGDNSKTATDDSAASTSTEYKYEFRELAEPEYIKPAEEFSGGTGTAEDPYQIADEAELSLMSEKLNNDESRNDYSSCYYVLTDDISLNDTENYQNWSEEGPQYSWKPISKGAYNFTGTFDGNGHTVSGIYININIEDENAIDSKVGLFGSVEGTVKNLNIDKSYICASGYTGKIGGICGEAYNENAHLSNCKSAVNIDTYDAYCGGIVGLSTGSVKISDCVFSGEINQVKDNANNIIGGILGNGSAQIENCENKGTISSNATDAEHIGGIAGRLSEGSIKECKNTGKVLGGTDANEEGIGVSAGGIVGSLYISNIGGESASKGITVNNCENLGEVSGAYHTAGIAAELSNDKSENAITVSGCKNSGKVSGSEKISGIISLINSEGADINIENCENNTEISGNEAGGIIREIFGVKGKLSINGCTNSANITSEGLYCAGIVTYVTLSKDTDIKINLEKCTNNGKIVTSECGGGIIGFSDNSTALSSTENTEFSLKGCINNGDVYTSSSNAFIGGIAGNLGLAEVKTTLTDCANTGLLEFEDNAPDDETTNAQADERFQLTRMCGGIIGRVGSGLVLVADSSKGNDENVNKDDAYIQIADCYSNGKFVVPDEEKYLNADGTPIYTNVIGGIIGCCTGETEFSLNVTDCGYCNVERGMGEEFFKNVGTEMSENDIQAKINTLK